MPNAKDQVMKDVGLDADRTEADKIIPAARYDALQAAVVDTIRNDPGMQAAQPIYRAAMMLRLGDRIQARAFEMHRTAADPVFDEDPV